MKVRAMTNIKYGLGWYTAGEVFEIPESDMAALAGLAEPVAGMPAAAPAPKGAPAKKTEPTGEQMNLLDGAETEKTPEAVKAEKKEKKPEAKKAAERKPAPKRATKKPAANN